MACTSRRIGADEDEDKGRDRDKGKVQVEDEDREEVEVDRCQSANSSFKVGATSEIVAVFAMSQRKKDRKLHQWN